MTEDDWTRSFVGEPEEAPQETPEAESDALAEAPPLKPLEAEPVEAEPVEAEPVEAEPVEAEAPSAPAEPEPHRIFAGTGISWAFIFGTLLTVAIIVLAVQNTGPVPVKLYFWDLEAPLIIVMLVTALAAIVVDELIGLIIRRRRRRVLAEREELKRLRARTEGKVE